MNFRASLATYVFLGLVSNFTILLPHLKKKEEEEGSEKTELTQVL